ncbi:MAG: hypothetical protein HY320_06005 [Armatimonadetes bacterium]|nr:hypothetical protein [Armatimonadota bacterium]
MQKDTRRLTVARDHLRSAHEEIRLALDQTDIHVQQSAVRRAVDHLQMARSRLLEQRELVRGETDEAVHAAYDHTSRAGTAAFSMVDRWPTDPFPDLDTVRGEILAALEQVERACEVGQREEQMHH